MVCRDRNKVYQYGLLSSVCLLVVLVGIVVALVVMEVIVLDFTSHKNGTDTKSLDPGSDETPLDPPVRKNVTSTSYNGNKTRSGPGDTRTTTTAASTTVATTINIITPSRPASACGNGWIDATQVELGCLWIERQKDFIQEKNLLSRSSHRCSWIRLRSFLNAIQKCLILPYSDSRHRSSTLV